MERDVHVWSRLHECVRVKHEGGVTNAIFRIKYFIPSHPQIINNKLKTSFSVFLSVDSIVHQTTNIFFHPHPYKSSRTLTSILNLSCVRQTNTLLGRTTHVSFNLSSPGQVGQSRPFAGVRTKAQLSTAGTDNKRREIAQFVAAIFIWHYY